MYEVLELSEPHVSDSLSIDGITHSESSAGSVLNLSACVKSYSATIQITAIEQYFAVGLFIMPYRPGGSW